MLLTENIALRVREWLDRETEEPDLVPRFRRLWTEPRLEPVREDAVAHSSAALRGQPVLEQRAGV
jgi:hypothetical protein